MNWRGSWQRKWSASCVCVCHDPAKLSLQIWGQGDFWESSANHSTFQAGDLVWFSQFGLPDNRLWTPKQNHCLTIMLLNTDLNWAISNLIWDKPSAKYTWMTIQICWIRQSSQILYLYIFIDLYTFIQPGAPFLVGEHASVFCLISCAFW